MSRQLMEKESVALTKCFYCGKSADILLATKYYRTKNGTVQPVEDLSEFNGKADPRYPCDDCKEKMKIGIMLCEVRDGESGNTPYRTGRLWVMKQDACERIFQNFDFSKVRFTFIEESLAKQIGLYDIEPVHKE